MNILQILPRLTVGGVETGTVDLAKFLVKRGHKCIVVSGGGDLVAELEAHGIIHYTLPVDQKVFWEMFRAARKLAAIIKKEDIEIVHARSRVPAWVGFMATRKAPQAVLITTAHGHYSRHIFSYMMGWGKYTIVPSAVIGKHMIEDFSVPFENIRLIPRSVDLERYPYGGLKPRSGKSFTIGVIGRVTPIKGQIYFLKAMARVLRSFSYVKAWIVGGVSAGKDAYMEELEVCQRRLGLTESVSFFGNRRDIPEILKQLDCLVMPSIAEESFGRVIVEANAIGVPVVASKVGGVVEIIDDKENGFLVSPKDPDEMSEAIIAIIKDEVLARRVTANARRKVEEKFSLEKMADDTLAVYEEARSVPRILVIKISAIGDAVLAVPSLKALKKKFLRSRLVCLTGIQSRDVFKRCPYIDELIVYDPKGKDKGARAFFRLAKKLMRRRFDFVVDFQNNKKSHLLSYATFSHYRYGYDNGKFSFLLNRKIRDTREPIGPVEHQFRVLKMLGIDYCNEALELWPSEEDKKFAEGLLAKEGGFKGPLIGLNIGASPGWPSKRWSAHRFAEFADRLTVNGYSVVLTGSVQDASYAKKILKESQGKILCVVARTTLMQLACVIGRCAAYVTSDSAPMHVAAAMRVPFVALFGPTDPRRHRPPARFCVVLQKGCVPCYEGFCSKKTHVCMTSITVDDCLSSIEKLLKENATI